MNNIADQSKTQTRGNAAQKITLGVIATAKKQADEDEKEEPMTKET